MSVVTVAATVELGNTPPRVRLDVTDIGSPNVFSTTVIRLDPDGRSVPVRTADGKPLTLITSGANRTGLVYDYEMPYGQPVSYSTLESPSSSSGEVTVNETRVWLVHPGVPALSMPVEFRAGSLAERTFGVNQGVLYPMGRRSPIVVTDGSRRSMQSAVILAVESLDELSRVESLISDAGTLLMNIPAGMKLGVPTSYVAVSDVVEESVTGIGSDPYYNVRMSFVVVDRPAGGSQAQRTYPDLLNYTSYTALRSAYSSYLDLLAGP